MKPGFDSNRMAILRSGVIQVVVRSDNGVVARSLPILFLFSPRFKAHSRNLQNSRLQKIEQSV